ncbi:MAG: DUF1501 domain-containing protein [Planctomycetaceae bacterium]|nr:DUF1501 domain-containing protein [Planctomycetaceae bacterium]
MLTIGGSKAGQRISRRAVLQLGALGGGALTLADLLRCRSTAAAGASVRRDTAVIHLFMGGGPSHIDMFDLKPQAPREIRGEFQPIATSVPGLEICEHLPCLAKSMQHLAVIRSAAHAEPSHLPASHWMVTGYRPSPGTTTNVNPYCGAVVAKQRGANIPGLPPYVSIPRRQLLGGPAYLGTSFNPFTTDSDPNADNYAVPNLNFAQGLSVARLADRQGLKRELDRLRRQVDRDGEFAGLDRFSREAFDMVAGRRAQEAFDIGREDPAVRERYGRTPAGQRCLLARRLVEAGCTFVTVLSGGEWDTHVNNFAGLKNDSLPPFDRALSALVADLQARGLDRRVLVLVTGEFGRTPTINKQAGRDHWPGAFSVLFAGGGLRVGQVIGATDSRGAQPITHPYSPEDMLATVYHFLGIDPSHEFLDRNGRPLRILNSGAPIAELLS